MGTITFAFLKAAATIGNNNLAHHQVTVHESHLFGQPTLELQDPHELSLALVEGEAAETNAILGFHGAVLLSAKPEETFKTLTHRSRAASCSGDRIKPTIGDCRTSETRDSPYQQSH